MGTAAEQRDADWAEPEHDAGRHFNPNPPQAVRAFDSGWRSGFTNGHVDADKTRCHGACLDLEASRGATSIWS